MTKAYDYWFEHREENGVNFATVAAKFGVKPKSLTERASKAMKKLGIKTDGRKKRHGNSIHPQPQSQACLTKIDSRCQTPG